MRHPYADFIDRVAKPGRYLGGEYNSVIKDPATVDVSIVLAFPDVYDIGMSHLGTKILYQVLNQNPRIACERAFAPWPDMEAELRQHGLPVLSLERARPLREFDVIGMSLQYELTYTNCLLLLELSGLPLHAADRGDDLPLVIAGGPTATHPEPMAPFFDAFFIGEGEQALPDLLLAYKALRQRGLGKLAALARVAQRGALYVPALYESKVCRDSGLQYVEPRLPAPGEPAAPARVTRAWVEDLAKFPFPDDSPVPYAEAIFDRAGVEIARGCTEGCRFCQAGMIYRPVRERSPDQIIDAVLGGVRKGGYDETAITSLSTADYSCVTPLVTNLMKKLRDEKVSLSVSSLRAYGLNEELLDELSSVRATGLTFAPEAGTQRMRDVINKNITEAHITESAERVFSRGWTRMKLYFMIGLPTERDEDVQGIVEFGTRVRRIGRQKAQGARVTVSVSSHVPKPHTPFQWCAQDSMAEIERKQAILDATARATKSEVKYHEAGMSHVEGWLSRGDRRMAPVIEAVYRAGGRFDSWDEFFSLERWQRAAAEVGLDPVRAYLGTIPLSAKLPWDHIDVGLADGFLAKEYRKALKDRLSPPCGKVVDKLLHPTSVVEHEAEQRPLVCYECGVACDLTDMRAERLVFLRKMGAEQPRQKAEPAGISLEKLSGPPPAATPRVRFEQGAATRFRLRFTKLGRAAFMSHLDLTRMLMRVVRRAGLEAIYSQGFHPKPVIVFSPALALGIQSLAELVDINLGGAEVLDLGPDELARRLTAKAPEGVVFEAARRLPVGEPGLGKVVGAARFAAQVAGLSLGALREQLAAAEAAGGPLKVTRASNDRRRAARELDVRDYLLSARATTVADEPELGALEWDPAGGAVLELVVRLDADGSAKPSEVVRALLAPAPGVAVRHARLALLAPDAVTDAMSWRPPLVTTAAPMTLGALPAQAPDPLANEEAVS